MSQKQILVVEDEEIARDVLIQALETLGFAAVGALNGRHALEVMQTVPVDLVLTDIYMPELNGLELLRKLRDDGNEIPVILITGFDADEARQISEEYRATALLLKPFRLVQLKGLLEGVFGTT